MAESVYLPVVSEKVAALIDQQQTYTFRVPQDATKAEVARLISQRFKVKVTRVNIINQSGKLTRSIVQRGRQRINGKRADSKKAYVTLAAGSSINFDDSKQAAKVKGKKGKENG